ncbi:diaminohydroxyphosphoribosylaminopyrimidine deaminase [Idiomarina loihiensis]|uniref:bifunctional diaminohydroxyphosphoribosylaminopyrimidine deaminase/5-amino-6-(5-phosphoribosylamino)uracil reductase RibD n=1 Tax=Idiomarina TaxID=135575 RepID=UPI000D913258|nr:MULTISPECIES: bifunctional diaminohydroxyphosphoribosylaminopyrimidine deaminase/5-amino-6-(5-phosphoribosylamino)uracil reductase RibD [Idiomarina]PWW40327.1 diaminohydroxyphosphoribosylaminopyrimidine deaminase [Idiomarina loihiensis]TDP50018.1 diaminohydroxyphosphoribosylaminopyrimidine deaminase [Idiomarina loihiensis]TDS24630.1 diaminohydroxyphosphoribosylaminopyrimidine deaminase [Idiomarina sp. H2]
MSLSDIEAMQRAIELAKAGIYSAQPNPRVGCVLVKDGEIVGEGAHLKPGELHAERNALLAAGDKAKGATAYVTLEPCCHWGRTPPCCDALIESQVACVFVAMVDPNPQVAGKGIEILRTADICVEVGLLEQQARDLNPGFIACMSEGRPYVRAKLAMSLDGKTAMADGESQWITTADARQDVQRWRARSCAVITGSGTVIADDPSLNVRWQEWDYQYKPESSRQRQPRRVIVDSKAQCKSAIKMLTLEGETWLATLSQDSEKQEQWQQAGGHWHLAEENNGKVALDALVQALGTDCNEILVEAGPELIGAFAEQDLIDEYLIYVAPKFLGADARSLLDLPQIKRLADHKSVDFIYISRVGDDLLIRATAR